MSNDLVDGYRLDRAFQILNTAYPAVRQTLDLPAPEVHVSRVSGPRAAVLADRFQGHRSTAAR